jgi:hypothetical protein
MEKLQEVSITPFCFAEWLKATGQCVRVTEHMLNGHAQGKIVVVVTDAKGV